MASGRTICCLACCTRISAANLVSRIMTGALGLPPLRCYKHRRAPFDSAPKGRAISLGDFWIMRHRLIGQAKVAGRANRRADRVRTCCSLCPAVGVQWATSVTFQHGASARRKPCPRSATGSTSCSAAAARCRNGGRRHRGRLPGREDSCRRVHLWGGAARQAACRPASCTIRRPSRGPRATAEHPAARSSPGSAFRAASSPVPPGRRRPSKSRFVSRWCRPASTRRCWPPRCTGPRCR